MQAHPVPVRTRLRPAEHRRVDHVGAPMDTVRLGGKSNESSKKISLRFPYETVGYLEGLRAFVSDIRPIAQVALTAPRPVR